MTNRITGLNSGLDTESLITALTQTYQTRVDKQTSAQTKLSYKQDAWKTANKGVTSFYNGKLSEMRFSSAYNKKTTTSSSSAVSVVTGDSAMNATQTVSKTSLAKSSYLTGNKLSTTDDSTLSSSSTMESLGMISGDSKTLAFKMGEDGESLSISIDSSDTISSVISKINSASSDSGLGLKASYDSTNGRIYLAAEDTGVENQFVLDTDNSDSDLTDMLGLTTTTDGTTTVNNYVEAEDATLTLNGVEYTSSSNTFEINGLTISVNSATDDEFTLTTKNDTSGVYDEVKDFISEYNSLMENLLTLYNADDASDYDILTSDQKSEMTDDEIEEWTTKIKSGILSGDETLKNVIDSMRSAMSGTFQVTTKDGTTETWSLATLGINTKSYFDAEENERASYHIDGNSDDEYSSGNTDLLSAKIANDPDAVADFFTQLTKSVYASIGNLMKGTDYSSAYTVYEDKLMASQYSSYTTSISKAQSALEDKQDYYYEKFAAMETALSKLNSNSSSLSSMLG